tara:strand:- start:2201 stop:2620 length:420 start_codon:yes stop_codon:yes gene_type:complete
MSNKKEWMYKKLNRLVKLCKATEPEKPDDTHLFMPTTIDAYDMLNDVEDNYDDMSLVEIKKIMIEANKIWKFRKKVYNGDIDWNWQSQLDGELEAMILQGSVINAIKHYRKEIEKETGTIPSLREGKDYVDKMRTTVGK